MAADRQNKKDLDPPRRSGEHIMSIRVTGHDLGRLSKSVAAHVGTLMEA